MTGGAGFIGSAVCRHFVANTDVEIINIDKLTYAANLNSLASVSKSERYQFVKGDVCDGTLLDEVFQKYEPDAVMHLAAESHVDRSITGSADFIQTNIVGTYTLLEATRRWWQALSESRQKDFRFLHVSTDEVYGSLGSEGVFSETTAYSPNSPYASSKASADHLVNAWHHTYGLPVLITNCSNNYGPYHFPEKLIPLVIINALEEKPLPVYGTGSNVRDWLYVEDHARALDLILRQGAPGEKYNIGGRNERTNLEVVQAICDYLDEIKRAATVTSRRNLIEFVADRPGHDQRYAIDASKLEDELGWRAQENFETGLYKTVEWYLANESWWKPLRSGIYGGERLGLLPADKKRAERVKTYSQEGPILVVGRYGQVAQALDERGFEGIPHVALGRDMIDLTNPDSVARAFAAYSPRLVINAAAYTAVDKAESEPEAAFAVNSGGAEILARHCADAKIPLIHISTDYVFDGKKTDPYVEDDPVAPLNVYGASKAKGEDSVRGLLREHVILRTSWVFSSTGNNFIKTMLRFAESRDQLSVVGDQYGTPTFSADIAHAIKLISARLINGEGEFGTYHLAGSGETSWYGFAREIFARTAAYGVTTPTINAIPSSSYPTSALRPMNSRLDCGKIKNAYGIVLPSWKSSLATCLNALLKSAERESVL